MCPWISQNGALRLSIGYIQIPGQKKTQSSTYQIGVLRLKAGHFQTSKHKNGFLNNTKQCSEANLWLFSDIQTKEWLLEHHKMVFLSKKFGYIQIFCQKISHWTSYYGVLRINSSHFQMSEQKNRSSDILKWCSDFFQTSNKKNRFTSISKF